MRTHAKLPSHPPPGQVGDPEPSRRRRTAPDNQATQQRLGARIHEDTAAEALLRPANRRGAALGRDVFVDPGLAPADRARVLRHELRHVAQVGGHETDPSRPVRAGPAGDRFEADAASTSADTTAGADPQVLRFFDEPDGTATSCSAEPEENSCSAESPAPGEGIEPTFRAADIDVPGMRNDDLNAESMAVDDWFAVERDSSDVDEPEYTLLRQRLKAERTERVRTGHLWMTTATRETPTDFYMLVPSADGRTAINWVWPEVALGVPDQSFPGPVMTLQQFEDHMATLGIPILTDAEYEELLAQTGQGKKGGVSRGAGAGASWDPDDPFGLRMYTGGLGMLDTRASLLQRTLPYGNVDVRAGDIAEAFALTAPRDQLRGRNLNASPLGWSGDWLRPLRPMRGAEPIADVRVVSGSPFVDLSVKTTRPGTQAAASPSLRTQFGTYFSGHVDMLDTQASKFGTFAAGTHPGMPLVDVSAGIGLAIPPEHVQPYRDTLMDPTGRDLTDTGRAATKPNHDLGPYKAIYELTAFPQPVVLPDGLPPLTTGADLYAARKSGRITPAQFDTHIRTIGVAAANRVVEIPGYHRGMLDWYEGFRGSLGTQNGTDIRAAVNVDTMRVVEEMRRRQQLSNPNAPYSATSGWAETHAISTRNAGRGGALRGGISVLSDLALNDNADLSDPAYRNALLQRGAVETVAGATSEYGESALRARAGLYMAREGLSATAPRALLLRAGARAVPGLADAGVEVFGMATDGRDNSTEEVVTRTTRAAVIGTGSAYAGAAIGTAIGGPVGFIVGLGVGAAVGWLANKFTPGGAEEWERRARIDQKLDQISRQLDEMIRVLEEQQKRRDRLNTGLDSQAASVAGVEGLSGLPTSNPLFTTCEEDVVPTVGELEAEYIRATLDSLGGGAPNLSGPLPTCGP